PDDEPAPPAFWEAPNEDIELDTGVQLRRTALLLEGRAGMHVDGLAPSPGGTIGVGLRVPVLDAEQARLLSVGLGLDGAYLNGEARVTQAGAVVGVSRFTHAFVALTADARLRLLAVGDTAEIYAGLGGGVLLGRATLSGYRGDVDAGTRGFLGAASAGVTMGTAGHRPFLEVRGWAGALASPLVRAGAGEAPGGGSGFFALAAVVGYRFEFLGQASAAR
ncbi:MAG: hypothetical protein KC933_34015, partial [Myxococcales bacterium]|nr:hypothetical protein [Myxococcales bacterium]